MHNLPRILALDDMEMNLLILRDLFQGLAQMDFAKNCAEADRAARTQHYQLLLFDVRLPDGTSDQILRRIRRSNHYASQHSGAFALTAELTDSTRVVLKAAGFNQMFSKPWRGDQIVAASKAYLAPLDPRFDYVEPFKKLNYNAELLLSLQKLFDHEARTKRVSLAAALAKQEWSKIGESIHQLTAAAGFAAATSIEQAIQRYRALQTSDPEAGVYQLIAALDAFIAAAPGASDQSKPSEPDK